MCVCSEACVCADPLSVSDVIYKWFVSGVAAPEPMVNLQSVKNDSYEKGTDLMVVNVYIKGICRDSARVIFREQDFTLIFQTR